MNSRSNSECHVEVESTQSSYREDTHKGHTPCKWERASETGRQKKGKQMVTKGQRNRGTPVSCWDSRVVAGFSDTRMSE